MQEMIYKLRYLLSGNLPGKLISIIVGSSLLFAAYLFLSRGVLYNSDNAGIVLEAQSMLHGNALLRGWYTPTDDFLTIEIPLYALGLLLGFSMPSLLHIIPALLYTLVVICGGYLASTLLQGKHRILCLLAFLGLVAFLTLDLAQSLLMGPTHMGTILLALVGLLLYRRFLLGGKGKRVALAVILLLTVLLVVGDPFALVFFVLPLILVESIQMLVEKRLSVQGILVVATLLLMTILSFGIRWLLGIAGVHILLTAGFVPADIPDMLHNFVNAILLSFTLFHADIFQRSALSLPGLPFFINALAVFVLIYAIVRGTIRFLFLAATTTTKIVSALLWGLLAVFAAYTLSTLGETGAAGTRYLFPFLFFGGIVSFAAIYPFVKKNILTIAVALLFTMNATLFVVSTYQAPTVVVPEAQLITSLEAHHLTQGLGTYWVAPIATVQSEDRVVIRQVMVTNNQIQPEYFLVDGQWFNPSNLRNANFIVYMDRDNPGAYYSASVRSFGVPDYQYRLGVYTVLAWNTPLLTHMRRGSAL
jgi:hypothetical protein